MAWIGVAEAAARLGVGARRVHQRIADGSLPAERVGSQWVIDEASLPVVAERRQAGRPLSERSAWALVAVSRGVAGGLAGLAPVERSRAEKRLVALLPKDLSGDGLAEEQVRDVARALRLLMRNRAKRLLWRASVRDLPDLREDHRIAVSGISDPRSGIASGDLVEGYVAENVAEAVVDDYLLIKEGADSKANVIFHASPLFASPAEGIDLLLLAADLAEHRRPREEARAAELLRELALRRVKDGTSGDAL